MRTQRESRTMPPITSQATVALPLVLATSIDHARAEVFRFCRLSAEARTSCNPSEGSDLCRFVRQPFVVRRRHDPTTTRTGDHSMSVGREAYPLCHRTHLLSSTELNLGCVEDGQPSIACLLMSFGQAKRDS